MPDDEHEDDPEWWEAYGLTPTDPTSTVEAALIGDAVARQCADDASAALLHTLAVRMTPFVKGQPQAKQAAASAAVAAIFRQVATRYEDFFQDLEGRGDE